MIRHAQSQRTEVSCLIWWPRPSCLSLLFQTLLPLLTSEAGWVGGAERLSLLHWWVSWVYGCKQERDFFARVGLKVTTVISSLPSLLPILDSSQSRLEPLRSPLLKRIIILLLSSLVLVLLPKALLQWTSCKQISTWELFFRESDLRTVWHRKNLCKCKLAFFFPLSVLLLS